MMSEKRAVKTKRWSSRNVVAMGFMSLFRDVKHRLAKFVLLKITILKKR